MFTFFFFKYFVRVSFFLVFNRTRGDCFLKVWVLADEIYERLVYDGEEHVSFAAVSAPSSGFQGGDKSGGEKVSMWDRTLVVNGFSKVSDACAGQN